MNHHSPLALLFTACFLIPLHDYLSLSDLCQPEAQFGLKNIIDQPFCFSHHLLLQVDLEGKRAAWEGIVKIPFVDEVRRVCVLCMWCVVPVCSLLSLRSSNFVDNQYAPSC